MCRWQSSDTVPYLPWSSPSGLRLRMAWISSKIRQPAAAQRSQFVYKLNLSPDKKQREKHPHLSSLWHHRCCNATYGTWAASPSTPAAHRGSDLCSECCRADPMIKISTHDAHYSSRTTFWKITQLLKNVTLTRVVMRRRKAIVTAYSPLGCSIWTSRLP